MRARYYLNEKLADSEAAVPIYISIHHRSERLRYYTGERIRPENWDRERQRARTSYIGHASLNNLLDVLAEEPRTIERNARISGIDCTVEYLKQQLSFNRIKPKDFVGTLDEFIKEERLRKRWSQGTEKRWWFFRNDLMLFDKTVQLEFASIDIPFVQAYIKAMLLQGYSNAIIRNHIRMMIQFVRWARKKGYHDSTAYRDIDVYIRIQRWETNFIYLTIEELARVNQLTFNENETKYERARDVFLFSCFTGLRYCDLQDLRRYSIKYNYLIIKPKSTDDSIRVPLVDHARTILEKYKDSGDIRPVPVISQQKYNEYLKIIGKRAELNDKIARIHFKGQGRIETILPKWKLLTSLAGRRTFVSLAVFLDIPLETVSMITGLKAEAIQAYFEIPHARKQIRMQQLDNLKISSEPGRDREGVDADWGFY